MQLIYSSRWYQDFPWVSFCRQTLSQFLTTEEPLKLPASEHCKEVFTYPFHKWWLYRLWYPNQTLASLTPLRSYAPEHLLRFWYWINSRAEQKLEPTTLSPAGSRTIAHYPPKICTSWINQPARMANDLLSFLHGEVFLSHLRLTIF